MNRRAFVSVLAAAALQAEKGPVLPSETRRYSDPATELEVFRLTNPQFTSVLPPVYQRAISRKSSFLLYSSDRGGSLQVYRMDLKSGESRQLTEAEALDPSSVTLLPDEHSFCYFDGASLRHQSARDREVYRVPQAWTRCPGFSVTDDGIYAAFGEKQGGSSRLRLVNLAKGAVSSVVEGPGLIQEPLPRPRRTQITYRRDGLWLVNFDGQQNRRLKTESAGPLEWAPGGKTLLYLHFPEEATSLNTLREHTPDENSDHLLAKTSQFVEFGTNGDASVFVGASRSKASPAVLLLLRVTRREFTLCEHRASNPAMVSPVFSPNSQSVFFQSDRDGKPAIYRIRVDRLVEETGDST